MSFDNLGGLSSSVGPIGCFGAVVFIVLTVAAVLGLLYMPWSLVLNPP